MSLIQQWAHCEWFCKCCHQHGAAEVRVRTGQIGYHYHADAFDAVQRDHADRSPVCACNNGDRGIEAVRG